jgi:tol-pal system protein YbgF
MTMTFPMRPLAAVLLCLAMPSTASAFIFGDREDDRRRPLAIPAQMSGADAAVRIQQLEGQMRGLNGRIEQLEFQLRRMEDQLKRFQGDVDFRFQEMQGGGARPAARPAPPAPKPRADVIDDAGAAPAGGAVAAVAPRRLDDPPGSSASVAAPPRVLGQIPAGAADIIQPEGGEPGAPLVLAPPGAMPPPVVQQRGAAAAPPVGMPSSPPRPESARSGTVVASAPSNSPRDEFDLGVGFVQRKDFELAEMTFRRFLEDHPDDRLAPEAQYWLGESLYQRGQYRDAAEIFLKVTTEATGSAKAPESMLRLGMSLSGLGEREAACATYAEIVKKYPRASGGVRAQIERETKRVRC